MLSKSRQGHCESRSEKRASSPSIGLAELTIVEDDIFADFETTPAPRLAAFDGLHRVVQVGSFSEDPVGVGALHCGPRGLDRQARRPPTRHAVR
jgi:hypothetical protein